ncbi:hypothetical protein HK100_011207 [Physocladia obscura]|uniref:S-adenosyl-L-methionine-dependent methyltransferase n=1 Tax=Physocladia obscura TaxID=109957 RepID=A0AAD5T4H5_9FUNG|nr:hypothetical protein HK100_011207 [Physocladia obscura]
MRRYVVSKLMSRRYQHSSVTGETCDSTRGGRASDWSKGGGEFVAAVRDHARDDAEGRARLVAAGRSPYGVGETVADVAVVAATASGVGVGVGTDGWLLAAPLVAAGETATLRVYGHLRAGVSLCDPVQVTQQSPHRVVPPCPLHTTCSACVHQHLDYNHQLTVKHSLLVAAYAALATPHQPVIIPPVLPSPRQIHARNKISVHHERVRANEPIAALGFLERGRHRKVVDVAHCPVADHAVNAGLAMIRKQVMGSTSTHSGLAATYMVRQTLLPTSDPPAPPVPTVSSTPSSSTSSNLAPKTMSLQDFVKVMKNKKKKPAGLDTKDPRPLHAILNQTPTTTVQQYPPENFSFYPVISRSAVVQDIVNGHVFRSPSNSFYQVNSYLLPTLCSYVTSQLSAHCSSADNTLIDAYCGTGLFAITQSHTFKNVIGIELDSDSIAWARQNAIDNGVSNVRFVGGDVAHLFDGVVSMVKQQQDTKETTTANIGDNLALIIDPPKKGCSRDFIEQVMRLQPRVIIYVSCNPESQIKDLQIMQQLARDGVPPASFKGNVGDMVVVSTAAAGGKSHKEKNGGSNNSDLEPESSRVLYLGTKKIVKDSDGVVKIMAVDSETQERPLVMPQAGLARTLLKVKGYKIVQVQPFDMFPHSHRIEVVTTLVRED